MALKSPSIGDVLQGFNGLLGDSGLKNEVDKSLHSLVQAALGRLDMVSREEFDAQTEILARTRSRVEELEQQLETLSQSAFHTNSD
jgi:BMFP domain-containing protein YqiC